MTEFEARPPTHALVPAVAAGALAVVASVTAPIALAAAVSGLALLLLGGYDGNRRFVTIGGALLFVGVVFGGRYGMPPRLALAGGASAIVAVDAAEHAVSLGHDVGPRARVGPAVFVHVASTAAVAVLVAAFGYVLYRFGPGSLPFTALLALLLAAVMLSYGLRD